MTIKSNQLPHLKPEPTNQVSAKLEVYLLTFLGHSVSMVMEVSSHNITVFISEHFKRLVLQVNVHR